MLLIYGKNGVRKQYTPQDKDTILPVLMGRIGKGSISKVGIYMGLRVLDGTANKYENFHVNIMMEKKND